MRAWSDADRAWMQRVFSRRRSVWRDVPESAPWRRRRWVAGRAWEVSLHDLMQAGERSSLLARAFNSREGFSIRDDRLPARLFDPKPNGPDAGTRIFSEEDFKAAIEKYYAIIGCHPQTGRPSPGKLLALNLEWVADLLAAGNEG